MSKRIQAFLAGPMARRRLLRAAGWSTVTTAVLVLGSWLLLLLPPGDAGSHSALSVTPAEMVVAIATIPFVFGICFLAALLVIRSRER